MFFIPIVIGLSVDGLWTIMEYILSLFEDNLNAGDQTPNSLIDDATAMVVSAAANFTQSALSQLGNSTMQESLFMQ